MEHKIIVAQYQTTCPNVPKEITLLFVKKDDKLVPIKCMGLNFCKHDCKWSEDYLNGYISSSSS